MKCKVAVISSVSMIAGVIKTDKCAWNQFKSLVILYLLFTFHTIKGKQKEIIIKFNRVSPKANYLCSSGLNDPDYPCFAEKLFLVVV